MRSFGNTNKASHDGHRSQMAQISQKGKMTSAVMRVIAGYFPVGP